MAKHVTAVLALLLLAGASMASAEHLKRGDFELAFRFSYSDLGFDVGDRGSESKEFVASIGYMLTDHHEVGGGVGYFAVGSADTVEYGGRYAYNFRAGVSLNPYLAALILGFGGDRGDLFDLGYGVELGLKVYPGARGGALFGVAYRELEGADRGSDASHLILFGGLTLKF